jgi:Protein of unknown function (DUF4079)/Eukaryotic cytochrome b561
VEHDLAAQGGAAQLLAYAHPLLMLTALALVALALRAGLALRRARRRGARRDGRGYARHLRLAKLAVALLPVGFAAGVASAVLLRGWEALGSAHGWISSTTLALFLAAAFVGRKLERRSAPASPDPHALLGVLAALCAVASLFSGFVLLP